MVQEEFDHAELMRRKGFGGLGDDETVSSIPDEDCDLFGLFEFEVC